MCNWSDVLCVTEGGQITTYKTHNAITKPLLSVHHSCSRPQKARDLRHRSYYVHQRLHRHPQGCHDLPWQPHCWHHRHGGANP